MSDDEFRQPGEGFEDSGGPYWGPSNQFARFIYGRDGLLQLINARYKPIGSAWDAGRFARARALDALKKVKETGAAMNARLVAPWIVRAQQGKSGALYTLQDVLRNTLRNNQAINNAKAKAAREQIRRENTTRKVQGKLLGQRIRYPGLPGWSNAGRAGLDPGNPAAEALTEAWLGRRLDEDARRKRLSTFGRRGAAATRTVPRLTNRTGAGSTRALQSPSPVRTASSAASGASTGASTAAKGLGNTRRDTVAKAQKAAVESAQSVLARQVMGSTRSMTRSTTRSRTQSATARLFSELLAPRSQFSLRTQFTSLGRLRAPARTRVSTTATRTPSLASVPTLSTYAIGNQVGIGTQLAQEKCGCPKPKQKQRREPSCRNPIVSRTVRDGIITTKRKQQCLPSRSK